MQGALSLLQASLNAACAKLVEMSMTVCGLDPHRCVTARSRALRGLGICSGSSAQPGRRVANDVYLSIADFDALIRHPYTIHGALIAPPFGGHSR